MKIKIFILAAATTLVGFTANAQVSFGICAGVNLQNITGKDASGTDISNNKVVTRFNGGLKIHYLFAQDFFIQSGLMFASKGSKILTANIMLNYIEVPINFLYKPLLGNGHLILGFGPYLAYGVGGNVKFDGSSSATKVIYKSEETAADTGSFYFKPFEMGANFLAGFEFVNKISIQLNAQLGMTKINPTYPAGSTNKTAIKNTGFGLSLGYRF